MKHNLKIALLAAISLLFIALFLFTDLKGNIEYVLTRRFIKVVAIVLTGSAIAFSTVVFQTITQNRILTPNIMGLDSLYMLINAFIIFVFGSTKLTTMDKNFQFILIVGCMILFSGILYKLLFNKKKQHNLYFLLLVGFVIGTFFSSFTTFMEVLIDPNEFLVLQDKMFASYNNINTDVLYMAVALLILVTLYFIKHVKYLDVLALGKDISINLGVDYYAIVKRLLIIVCVLISISTALVGPITFLGLLVANLSYQFFKTYKHTYLILGAIFFSIIALVGGQYVVERIFGFSTTLSVIINFIGGLYFIYLLLKENRSW